MLLWCPERLDKDVQYKAYEKVKEEKISGLKQKGKDQLKPTRQMEGLRYIMQR